jgi:hypothetical protein
MSHMKEHLLSMTESIDETFGEGYAKKNPDLVGRLIQSELMVVAAASIQDGLYFLGSDVDDETYHTM